MLIFSNGVFDSPTTHAGLHAGHLSLMTFIVDLIPDDEDSEIMIAINTDKSARQLKGPGRPLKTYGERCDDVMTALEEFGRFKMPLISTHGFDGDVIEFLRSMRLSPDVLVKGAEYAGQAIPGATWCRRTVLSPMVPGISTTILESQR